MSCATLCQSCIPQSLCSAVNSLLFVGTGASSLGLLGPFLRVAILFTTACRVVEGKVGRGRIRMLVRKRISFQGLDGLQACDVR